MDNSVEYISFKARVALLHTVKWYIKLDLKDGYRQLPVHPSEWRTQVYTLGPNEFYIDIAMPFGKANSSKLFCKWSGLWFDSCVTRFRQCYRLHAALDSYVDDTFGGTLHTQTSQKLIDYITDSGASHGAEVNLRKTRGPATRMVILGLHYDSCSEVCALDPAKVKKYTCRIETILREGGTSSKNLEKIIGNLVFAA